MVLVVHGPWTEKKNLTFFCGQRWTAIQNKKHSWVQCTEKGKCSLHGIDYISYIQYNIRINVLTIMTYRNKMQMKITWKDPGTEKSNLSGSFCFSITTLCFVRPEDLIDIAGYILRSQGKALRCPDWPMCNIQFQSLWELFLHTE